MGRFDALTQLEDKPEQPSPAPSDSSPKPPKKNTALRANPQPSKALKSPLPQTTKTDRGQDIRPEVSPLPNTGQSLDTSLLTTKEKTKYGTYLTEESIEKISIRAIQLKRDAHQIVQEAINEYFKRVEK